MNGSKSSPVVRETQIFFNVCCHPPLAQLAESTGNHSNRDTQSRVAPSYPIYTDAATFGCLRIPTHSEQVTHRCKYRGELYVLFLILFSLKHVNTGLEG